MLQELVENGRKTEIGNENDSELIKEMEKLQWRKRELLRTNADLEKSLVQQIFGKDFQGHDLSAEPTPEELKVYAQAIEYYSASQAKHRDALESHNARTEKLSVELKEKKKTVKEADDIFGHFKYELSRQSRHPKTGKELDMGCIRTFCSEDEAKEELLYEERLKNVTLVYQIRALEDEIRSREQLSEGLHLIDFEQLKIENQALIEKIESRDKELDKISIKTNKAIQVLEELKEKQIVVQDNLEQSVSREKEIEKLVDGLRKHLQNLKREKDKIVKQKQEFLKRTRLASSPELLRDFSDLQKRLEEQREREEILKDRLEFLQGKATIQ